MFHARLQRAEVPSHPHRISTNMRAKGSSRQSVLGSLDSSTFPIVGEGISCASEAADLQETQP